MGVIDDVTVVLGPGMTALTGETGAGKTLLVDAIALLIGGPADPLLVRPGASEAIVEARFGDGDDQEVVVSRVIPTAGRSRSYVDGRMVSAAALAETGRSLVDLHGQHAHQSLLSASTQRAALDASAAISTTEVVEGRHLVRDINTALAALGGDQRARIRELDMLRFQLDEVDSARIDDPEEDRLLRAEEELLGDATGLRMAASQAFAALTEDDGALDRLGVASAALGGRDALAGLRSRLVSLQEELSDVASECRAFAESVEDDPERLIEVGARRKLLSDLRRKYGDTLAEVISFRETTRTRVAELESFEERAAELEGRLRQAEAGLSRATEQLWTARRAAAPKLAAAVEEHLARLSMAKARFDVHVGDTPGSEEVTWMLSANPGEPLLPLNKVASGGELARTMLASRLAVGPTASGPGEGPQTLVFDEVDAGIGGEAAVAVGEALAALGRTHQVLVVTHLPQVAACADHHLVVTKASSEDRTVASVRMVDGGDRVVELARMLSGSPDSLTARSHAEELLTRSAQSRGGSSKRARKLR